MINSIQQVGLQGVQKGMQQLQDAATDIAGLGQSQALTETSDVETGLQSGQDGIGSYIDAAVDLKQAEYQVKASALVIKTADQALGTLIDTLV